MPDNLAYCLNCGTKLDDETPTVVHPTPAPFIEPPPKQGSGALKFILGSLLGAVAVLLLLVIGGFVWFSMSDNPPPANLPVNNSNIEAPKTPTPRKPSPSPTVSATNENMEPKMMDRSCRITNPQGGSVNLRRNCDTRDCSMDASTLYTQGDPGETVIPTGRKPVTTGRFTWVEVKYGGEVLWISSTRMNCD